MSFALTPTLKKYAIITNSGMSGNGIVNITNGNYGTIISPSIYNVTINTSGAISGPNTADIPTVISDYNTLITTILTPCVGPKLSFATYHRQQTPQYSVR